MTWHDLRKLHQYVLLERGSMKIWIDVVADDDAEEEED